MLRRLLSYSMDATAPGKRLARLRPLVDAVDHFCYEPLINTHASPYLRDAVDLKRWMMLVVIALLPTVLVAIWNTGVLKWVYGSADPSLMRAYLEASHSLGDYFRFVFSEGRYLVILRYGALAFLPVMIISYLVGGLCEAIIACVRGHEIGEGFLVTGLLYPLILPPTIPYWMVALGIAFGVIVGKELFGGTGMNIFNPALTARCFLFFTFPAKMTGDVWVGTNPTAINTSLAQMNRAAALGEIDGFTQATPLAGLNVALPEIKNIHVDAIALQAMPTKEVQESIPTYGIIQEHLAQWQSHAQGHIYAIDHTEKLSAEGLRAFVTGPLSEGGLGLLPSNYSAAHQFVETRYGLDKFSDGNLFWGNIAGSMGETSTFACLLGALFLIWVGIGSWRTMLSFGLASFLVAFFFEFASTHFGVDAGAWNSAKYAIPAYRHLLMGGLAFGLVYMATDPVTSGSLNASRWVFGALAGTVAMLIRLINPAFPEGVMLAILFANVFAPLIDHIALYFYRRPYDRPKRTT